MASDPTFYYSRLVEALELTTDQRNRAVRALDCLLGSWGSPTEETLDEGDAVCNEDWAKEVLDG